MIWCGQETSDSGTGNVGPTVAALLDVPLVSNVVGWEFRDGLFEIEREIEDGHQFQEVAPVNDDQMNDLQGTQLLYVAGHAHALTNATLVRITASTGSDAAQAIVPVASTRPLIAMKLHAYLDPARVATICSGRTEGVTLGMTATHAQCQAWLKDKLIAHTLAVGPGVNPIGDRALAESEWSPERCAC